MRKILILTLLVVLVAAFTMDTASAANIAFAGNKASAPRKTMQVAQKVQMLTEKNDKHWSVPLTDEELEDVSDWEWQEEYGYYITNNYRHDFLTVWYDPFEKSYEVGHLYSSLSDEHVPNGVKVYPINRSYTNEYGNTFIPFVFTDHLHPEYQDDGDGVYWLLLENYNGLTFLEHNP